VTDHSGETPPPTRPGATAFLLDTTGSFDVLAAKAFIQSLHAQKDAAYGLAWKKRGELLSVLANIARKIDRLEVFVSERSTLASESVLDTVIDLFVYLTKYQLFLHDLAPPIESPLPADAPRPLSEHRVNVDFLIERAEFAHRPHRDFCEVVALCQVQFEQLHQLALTSSSVASRLDLAVSLWQLAADLIVWTAMNPSR
jgi:hypothetical protein